MDVGGWGVEGRVSDERVDVGGWGVEGRVSDERVDIVGWGDEGRRVSGERVDVVRWGVASRYRTKILLLLRSDSLQLKFTNIIVVSNFINQ